MQSAGSSLLSDVNESVNYEYGGGTFPGIWSTWRHWKLSIDFVVKCTVRLKYLTPLSPVMWSETSVLWQDRSQTKTGLGLEVLIGLGLASLMVLVLILVLQLWSWYCSFGLIDKQDHGFEQSSVKISKNTYYTPYCCLFNFSFCWTSVWGTIHAFT